MKHPRTPAARSARLPNLLPPDLSTAEERMLPYLCAGWTDQEISRELGLTDAAVQQQVESCLRKFGANGRGQLAARLLQGESRLERPL